MRVVVYDKTCVLRRRFLTPLWALGAHTYRALRGFDAAVGVASWGEAFAWLAARREPIREVQYWGHGRFGGAWVGEELFDASALQTRRGELDAVRERLAPDALVWFRTCATFGGKPGHDFAERLADVLGATVAGHTFNVAYHQSGLSVLRPGMRASWSEHEGIRDGTPETPANAFWSWAWRPRTLTALHTELPAALITR